MYHIQKYQILITIVLLPKKKILAEERYQERLDEIEIKQILLTH